MAKGVTDMRPPNFGVPGQQSEPYIHPEASPAVQRLTSGMAERAAARRTGALPHYAEPVGGGPRGPSIPRLDMPHESGLPMSAQAERTNSPQVSEVMAGTMGQRAQGSIVEAPAMAGMPPQQRSSDPNAFARELGLLPTDLLPNEAQQDPAYQHGSGSVFAVSQPHLAARYGVMRGGQRLMPQQLQQRMPPGQKQQSPIRPETLQGLQDLQNFQRQSDPAQIKAAEQEAEKQVVNSAAGHSASAGAPPELTPEEREKAQERLELMDSFEYSSLRNAMTRDVLNNPEQRKLIEARLQPLEIDDLIVRGRVTQRVPIIPKKFEVEFTSMNGFDDLALKRLIMQESQQLEVTQQYLLDKYAFMALTCGVTSINSTRLLPHLDSKGVFNDELFLEKFNFVLSQPLHMLASIGVNHTWFEMRVRKLFVAEKVGNT